MVLKVSRSALVKPAASRPFTPRSSCICGDASPCWTRMRSSTLLDCAHAPGAGAERRDRVRIGSEDQNAVLEILSFPPIVEIRGECLGRPFENDERRPVIVEMDFIECGQDCHSIGVERRPARLEHFLQLVSERLVDLLFGNIRRNLGDFSRDVRRRAEEDPLVDSEKEIPSLPLKTGQRGLDFGHFQ